MTFFLSHNEAGDSYYFLSLTLVTKKQKKKKKKQETPNNATHLIIVIKIYFSLCMLRCMCSLVIFNNISLSITPAKLIFSTLIISLCFNHSYFVIKNIPPLKNCISIKSFVNYLLLNRKKE